MKRILWLAVVMFLSSAMVVGSKQNTKIVRVVGVQKVLENLDGADCSDSVLFKEAARKGNLYDAQMRAKAEQMNEEVWDDIGDVVKEYRKDYAVKASCTDGLICSVAYYVVKYKESASVLLSRFEVVSQDESVHVLKREGTRFYLYEYSGLRWVDLYCLDKVWQVPVWGDKIYRSYLYFDY